MIPIFILRVFSVTKQYAPYAHNIFETSTKERPTMTKQIPLLHANSIFRQKTEKTTTKKQYFAEIYVTDTNTDNGHGHISASMIEQSPECTQVITHTSFMPGAGALLNGTTLGFIPVPARHFPDIRKDDVAKANRIIRIPLSECQFERGVKRQQSIEADINAGKYFYSIIGTANLCAFYLTVLCSSYYNYRLARENTIAETGFEPPEDHTGLVVITDDMDPEESVKLTLLNCTSAVQLLLESSGIQFDEGYVIPTSLANNILTEVANAEIVPVSLVEVQNDTNDAEDVPENNKDYGYT